MNRLSHSCWTRFTRGGTRLAALLLLNMGMAVSAPAQSPEGLPSWAPPGDARPPASGFSSSARNSGGIDPFPDDPVPVPMQGLVLLGLAGAAYGARRLRNNRA